MKLCTKCLKWKPFDDFYKVARLPDGHISQCKDCYRERVNNRMKAIRNKTYSPIREKKKKDEAFKIDKRKITPKALLTTYANIVECFVNNGDMTQKELAEKMGVSLFVATAALNKYFKRPDKNITLKSKI